MKSPDSFGLMPANYIRSTAGEGTFPDFIGPMMASSVKEPFDNPDSIFETKLYGYPGYCRN
jgi:hypothetical protein